MKINYNINHDLLADDVLKDLKGKPRIITWLVWSQIMHLSWFTPGKSCDFYQGQFSKDLGISQNTTRDALAYLVDKKVIRCVRAYSQKGLLPGRYVLTQSSIRIANKQYQKTKQAVSPGDTVNNINNIIKDVAVDTTHFNERMVPSAQSETKPNPIVEEYNELKKNNKLKQ